MVTVGLLQLLLLLQPPLERVEEAASARLRPDGPHHDGHLPVRSHVRGRRIRLLQLCAEQHRGVRERSRRESTEMGRGFEAFHFVAE